jgi:hypothetical protein
VVWNPGRDPLKTDAGRVSRMGKLYEIKGNLGCDLRHSPFLGAETLRFECDVIWDDIPPNVLRKGK